MNARFVPADYPNGRILLRAGIVDVGAVFPPVGVPHERLPWVWRLWVNGRTVADEGRGKTELSAKNAILTAWRDFCARSGLVEA